MIRNIFICFAAVAVFFITACSEPKAFNWGSVFDIDAISGGDNETKDQDSVLNGDDDNKITTDSADTDNAVKNDNIVNGDKDSLTNDNTVNDNNVVDNEKADLDSSSQFCGNTVVEGDEVCDGSLKSCIDIDSGKYSGGKAKCLTTCNGWDISTCELKNECTNGVKKCVDSTHFATCGDYNTDGYTEWGSSTVCPGSGTCSGAGVCSAACTTHYTYACYSGDVYYYDSCSNLEEKKEECGTSGYTGSPYCSSGHLYQDYITVGCTGSACSASTAGTKIQDCGTAGCASGSCNSCTTHYTYACYSGNVYWYDSCSNLEDIKENCAGAGCTSGVCNSTKAATWTDSATGLTWQNSLITTTYTKSSAATYCTGLSLGGFSSGWRLPTIGELRTLIQGCSTTQSSGTCPVTDSCTGWASCYNSSTCAACTTGNGPSDTGMYWDPELVDVGANYVSSTVLSDYSTSYGWAIDFTSASISYLGTTSAGYVRCVRGGSIAAPTGVSATDGTTAAYVTITWSAVAGAEKYYVYRSTSATGTYSIINSSGTTSTSYTDYPPAVSTYYYYKVTAYSSSYGESTLSAYDQGWCY